MSVARVARHEVRQAWRTRLLVALAVAQTLLLLGATAVGVARQVGERDQRARYQAIVGEQFREQPDRHPHRVSHYGYVLFRPPAPLGFFDTGVESYAGTSMFIEAHRQNPANFSDAAQADSTRRFGELTMATVVQLFVPLLIFVVAGLSVTRERESGTLWLLLCQGTSWARIVWGKLAGAAVVTLLVLAPGLVAAAAWLALAPVGWTLDTAWRALLLAATQVAYLFGCIALAVVVSSWHRTSRGALVTLTGLWIVLWVVLPRVVTGMAAAAYPIPSRAEFEARLEQHVRTLGDSHNPADPKFLALKEQYLRQYGVSRVEDLPLNYNGVVMFEGEKHTSEAFREHFGALLETYRRQARVIETAALLSPFLAMRTTSMALAGVDVAHVADYERQVEDYRFTLIQHLNELHMQEVSYARDRYQGAGENNVPSRQRISQDHWADAPTFEHRRPTVAWALAGQRLGVLALAGWTILLLGGVVWIGRRPVLV